VPALRHDVIVEQGADFRLALRWLSANGTPVDLTGYTAESQMRASHSSVSVVLSFSSTAGISSPTRILLGGAAGTVILEADAVATRAVTLRQGVYDVEVTSPAGAVTRLAEGRFLLSREVTL